MALHQPALRGPQEEALHRRYVEAQARMMVPARVRHGEDAERRRRTAALNLLEWPEKMHRLAVLALSARKRAILEARRIAALPSRRVRPRPIAPPQPPQSFPRGDVGTIQRAVCLYFNLEFTAMLVPWRGRVVVRPRQLAMYLARELTELSLPQIGRKFGGRDHTTVLHATRRIAELLLIDPAIATAVEAIRKALGTPAL